MNNKGQFSRKKTSNEHNACEGTFSAYSVSLQKTIYFWAQCLDGKSENTITSARIQVDDAKGRELIADKITRLSSLAPVFNSGGIEVHTKDNDFLFSIVGEDKDRHGRSSIILCGGTYRNVNLLEFSRIIDAEIDFFLKTYNRSLSEERLNQLKYGTACLHERLLESKRKSDIMRNALIIIALLVAATILTRCK